jgi:cell shape-determining protein MreC
VAIVLILLVESAGGFARFRGLTEKMLGPTQKIGVQFSLFVSLPYRMMLANYHSYQTLQLLESQSSQLAAALGQQQTLETENKALRSMVNATTSSREKQKILEPILGYSQPTIGNWDQAAQVGDPVFIDGELVGLVSRVSQNQAGITLLSQDYSQPLLARTSAGTTGMIYGNGQDLLLKQIPIEQQVAPGQIVYTAGQDGILPNWYIGTITEVHRHEGTPTQEAVVTQGVSFFTSQMVEVR